MKRKILVISITILFLLSILSVYITACCLLIDKASEASSRVMTTLEREKFYKNVDLLFEEEGVRIFPNNMYRNNVQTIPLSDYKKDFSEKSVLTGLQKHTEGFLKDNIQKVYVFDDITIVVDGERKSYGGGTNSPSMSSVYLINKGAENGTLGEGLEVILHAEISSILLKKYPDAFDEEAWRAINPEGFKYIDEGKSVYYDPEGSTISNVRDPSLYDSGAVYTYMWTTIVNDFNGFAKFLSTNYQWFWDAVKEHDRLKQKLDLTAQTFINVDQSYESFIKSQYEKYGIEWVLD